MNAKNNRAKGLDRNPLKWVFSMLFFLLTGLFQSSLAARPDTAALPVARDRNFAWGCNGHPMVQAVYLGNIDLQMSLLKEMGMTYYRVDMGLDQQGTMDTLIQRRYNELMEKAARNKITVIPIIFPPGREILYALPSAGIAYDRGFRMGHGFAAHYGKDFACYELGNENDLDIINDPPGDGADSSQYSMARLRVLAGFFRGMADGIKQVDLRARIIISNGGWRHYAYYDLLMKEGVKFDIIGYHWYDDIPNLKLVLKKLTRDYAGKTIWFTEVNRRGGSHNEEQNAMVKKYIKAIRHAGKNIRGFFMYELFDEPGIPYNTENANGLFKWQRYYDSVSYKPFALAIRKKISRNK